jgi:hypothetical protein
MDRELKLSRYVALAVGGSTDLRPTISPKFQRAAAFQRLFGVLLSPDLPLHELDLLQRWNTDFFRLSLVSIPAGFEERVLVHAVHHSQGDATVMASGGKTAPTSANTIRHNRKPTRNVGPAAKVPQITVTVPLVCIKGAQSCT